MPQSRPTANPRYQEEEKKDRTPTLPYRAQQLLNATGKMSLNWGLDCTSLCSMHAPAEFWTRNWMNNEI